jgi:hypothetical protein
MDGFRWHMTWPQMSPLKTMWPCDTPNLFFSNLCACLPMLFHRNMICSDTVSTHIILVLNLHPIRLYMVVFLQVTVLLSRKPNRVGFICFVDFLISTVGPRCVCKLSGTNENANLWALSIYHEQLDLWSHACLNILIGLATQGFLLNYYLTDKSKHFCNKEILTIPFTILHLCNVPTILFI